MSAPFLQLPARFTPPLSEDFPSEGPRIIALIERYWLLPDTEQPIRLDPWQKWLITRILETYPEGHPLAGQLRFRQVLVSVARQNGKTIIAAVLGLFGLLWHCPNPLVIGLASTLNQANICYDRVKYAVDSSPVLSHRVHSTGTRGLTRLDRPGIYKVNAGNGDALQGLPISLGIIDEVHLTHPDAWSAVVNGQRTITNALLVGITTAGDDSSALLKDLYARADRAITDPSEDEQFGAFIWESPEGSTIEDDDALLAANPAVAAGRVPLERFRSDIREDPGGDRARRRYAQNLFVTGSGDDSWMPVEVWDRARNLGADLPSGGLTFALAATPADGYATITATVRTGEESDYRFHTRAIAHLVSPVPSQIVALLAGLTERYRESQTTLDKRRHGHLVEPLRDKGVRVLALNSGEVIAASGRSWSLINTGRVEHPGQPLTRGQVLVAQRKDVGTSFRVSGSQGAHVDALESHTFGLYVAENHPLVGFQFFTSA